MKHPIRSSAAALLVLLPLLPAVAAGAPQDGILRVERPVPDEYLVTTPASGTTARIVAGIDCDAPVALDTSRSPAVESLRMLYFHRGGGSWA